MDDPFYKSAKWVRLREKILRRDGYMCQYFKRYGRPRQANTVHHIFPRELYPQYEWEPWNLISLSHEAHNKMHDRETNSLTREGIELLKRTARRQDIPIADLQIETPEPVKEKPKNNSAVILIMGLRGCGKSTYAKKLIGADGLAYDLDAIASAFRLRMPHEERYKPARYMANDFLYGFLDKAPAYVDKIVVIRTAPGIEEVERICPDKIVWMRKRYVKRPMDDETAALDRISDVLSWAEAVGVAIDVR